MRLLNLVRCLKGMIISLRLVCYQLSRYCPDQSLMLHNTGEVIHPLIPTLSDEVTASDLSGSLLKGQSWLSLDFDSESWTVTSTLRKKLVWKTTSKWKCGMFGVLCLTDSTASCPRLNRTVSDTAASPSVVESLARDTKHSKQMTAVLCDNPYMCIMSH